MALSADQFYETSDPQTIAFQLTNSQVIFAGALIGIDTTTGLAVEWFDTANFIFAGIALRGVTGDTTASPGVDVDVNCGGMLLKKIPVTGVTAITNVGDLVFASDDNTFDVAATSNVAEVGIITRFYSGTTCDVQLFSLAQYQGMTNS